MKRLCMAVALSALAACDEDRPPPPPSAAVHWTELYALDCDKHKRVRLIRECEFAFYRRNRDDNPQLETEAFERCRLAADVMYCAWRKE